MKSHTLEQCFEDPGTTVLDLVTNY